MKILHLQSILCMLTLFNTCLSSQKLSTSEIDSIQFKVFDFIQANEQRGYDSTRSEILFVILETDSLSNISDIHLLSDEKNKGIVYEMFSRMPISALKGWKPAFFPQGTIIVPVYSEGANLGLKHYYADIAFWPMPWAGGIKGHVVKESKHSVVLSGILYMPPPPLQYCR